MRWQGGKNRTMNWKTLSANSWLIGTPKKRTHKKEQARISGTIVFRETVTENGYKSECYYHDNGPVYYTLEKLINDSRGVQSFKSQATRQVSAEETNATETEERKD